MKNALALVALASFISAACRAASPAPQVPGTLLACRKLPDETERVRCYDAQIDRMTATPVAEKQADSTTRFGQETLPAAARPKPNAQEDAALVSSISALRQVARATYAISLANGQIWRQEEASDISLFLHVGDTVRIEKGSLGSYRLSTDKTGAKNWVRVSRIQ